MKASKTAALGNGSSMTTRTLWRQTLRPKQWIKLVVYSLLMLNFIYYFLDDIERARYVFHSDWRWNDWAANFATTLDELAWFILLLILELETYLLSDDAFTRRRVVAMNLVKAICYVTISHTIFVFGKYVVDLTDAVRLVDTHLCAFADQGLSFSRNLDFWGLNTTNCTQLSSNNEFFLILGGQAITDAPGMVIEYELAVADFIEVIVWLVILLLIELIIKIQDRGISSNPILSCATFSKSLLYGVLWLLAAYWAYRGHWIFAWDEALWILGFSAISMNLSDWRKELAVK